MRIKKIELIGFKSFKDRTVIHFDGGITGIVGPNGCGKSNIVDALVWVMGEMSAKDLRGSSMLDVIFAGAENYAPSGMAEVSLTLENDGGPFPAKYFKHSEIMVTRRLHRDGESEYFVNKESARLRDVQEIFMDTGAGSKGFSIIQQGMIGRIITAKPEDRRMLIEEAAGITKFKMRKKESQRKIQATDQNLVRLQDIIGELKRQIDGLQRQAQKAERYLGLKNRIEELDLWISSFQFKDLKVAVDEYQRAFEEEQFLEAEGDASLSGLQAQLEEMRLSLLEQEKTLGILQVQHAHQQELIQKSELEVQELKFEIEATRRNEQMAGTLIHEQQERRELLVKDLHQLETQLEASKIEGESLSMELQERDGAYQDALVRVQEMDEQLTTARRQFFSLGQAESSLEAKVQALESQCGQLLERKTAEEETLLECRLKQEELEKHRTRIFDQLESARQMQLGTATDMGSFEEHRKGLQAQIVDRSREVEQFKDKFNEVTSLLYGLENLQNNFEGFEEGVKNVMLWQKTRQAEGTYAEGSFHFAPVSDVVEVPAEYEIAMEVALGPRLQMLLTTDSQQALEAVDHLKAQRAGRSSFYTSFTEKLESSDLELRKGNGRFLAASPQGEKGVRAILRDVVKGHQKYQQTVDYLLVGVAIVDSISTALGLRSRYEGWTFVTLDGDVLTHDGVLTGGDPEITESGVLKRRREIKELSSAKGEWAGKLALSQATLKKVQGNLDSATKNFEEAQRRYQGQELKLFELRKDFERCEEEVETAKYATEKQQKETLKLSESLSSMEEKLSELQELLKDTQVQKQEAESEVESCQQELTTLRLSFDGMQKAMAELRIKFASKAQEYSGIERQFSMVEKSVKDLDHQLLRMTEESQKSAIFISESQLRLEEKKNNFDRSIQGIEALRAQLAETKNLYEIQSAQIREVEGKIFEAQRLRHERMHKINETQLRLEQAKMKEQYLVDQIRERYMLHLPDIYQTHLLREGRVASTEEELKDLRDKLSKMGEVNLSAIEEYGETAKRYEFLVQQQSDLNEAKDQLGKVIDRINRLCSQRFKETFELVNEKFQKVFPVLFGGGEARLELVEDLEKEEIGIEITAKPPGKKMQSISLLSGGEKALTAVALIFSIFLVKPSPYCLLDEVDAPLDDVNVFRFNDLVREMAKRSQIILVTHNKHTMEVAGKLYGVTMQERGVSIMVSVNLQDLT